MQFLQKQQKYQTLQGVFVGQEIAWAYLVAKTQTANTRALEVRSCIKPSIEPRFVHYIDVAMVWKSTSSKPFRYQQIQQM
jgi:hypothetical protein